MREKELLAEHRAQARYGKCTMVCNASSLACSVVVHKYSFCILLFLI